MPTFIVHVVANRHNDVIAWAKYAQEFKASRHAANLGNGHYVAQIKVEAPSLEDVGENLPESITPPTPTAREISCRKGVKAAHVESSAACVPCGRCAACRGKLGDYPCPHEGIRSKENVPVTRHKYTSPDCMIAIREMRRADAVVPQKLAKKAKKCRRSTRDRRHLCACSVCRPDLKICPIVGHE